MGSLEMLAEEPESAEEAMTLAADVAVGLAARLQLLRAAWAGATGPLGIAEFCNLASGLQTRRSRLDFVMLDTEGQLSAAAARVALNVLMLASDCLGGSGVVHVGGNAQREVLVRIDGPRAAWPAGLAGYLAQDALAWQAVGRNTGIEASHGLQAPLTALIARSCNIRLSLLMAGARDVPPPLLIQLG